MKNLHKKMFGIYDVTFPVENKFTAVYGINGSGKTQLLKILKDYWEEKGEKVLYFSDNRLFSRNISETLWYLFAEDFLSEYKINTDLININELEGMPIRSGYHEILNFFGTIITHLEKDDDDVIVLIDEPERHLHLKFQRRLMNDIINLKNVKKLVVATHSPSIPEGNFNDMIDVKECVQLYERKYN